MAQWMCHTALQLILATKATNYMAMNRELVLMAPGLVLSLHV